MEKNKVVVFTTNNARILINPPDLDHWKTRVDALVNPDLSRVEGLAPHFWKVLDGHVHPLTPEERVEREEQHRVHGVDNQVQGPLCLEPARGPFIPDHLWQILTFVLLVLSILLGGWIGWHGP